MHHSYRLENSWGQHRLSTVLREKNRDTPEEMFFRGDKVNEGLLFGLTKANGGVVATPSRIGIGDES